MCGVLGFIFTHPAIVDISSALNSLAHRGPDDHGVLRWLPDRPIDRDGQSPCRVALGHTRLSILDLSPLGRQPMSTADNRWHLVFNGEVYNYIELRRELEAQGCIFHSRTDTEVVLIALATWGPERALPRFRGMFALALLDTRERRLLIARDPFGIKPLFLCRWRDGIAFASEVPLLRELPGVDLSLDAQRCWHYLRFGVTDHGDRTMVHGIHQLPAGCWSSAHIDQAHGLFSFVRYWNPASDRRNDLTFNQAAERFRHLFLDSVRIHLRSDVPIGTALSGGLDSSAITCAIRYINPRQELHTFSYLAADAALSESSWIDRVNAHVDARVHHVRVDETSLMHDLGRLTHIQGEPFGSTSIVAQFSVFRAAREAGVKVMLDGQGADEYLAGYEGYQGARLASMLACGQWLRASRLLRSQASWGRQWRHVIGSASNYLLPADLVPAARRLLGRTSAARWARRSWFAERQVAFGPPFSSARRGDRLRSALREDVSSRGLLALLRYEDRNSMSWSVESRVPFLVVDLVEFAQSLPESYLVGDDGSNKRILRSALRGIVPDAILDRRDKIGFATPELHWLKRMPGLVEDAITKARSIPCLDHQGISAYCHDVLSGRSPYDAQVWRLVNFVGWYRGLGIA